MRLLTTVQTVAIVGGGAFLYFTFKNSIIPNVAGFVDGVAGTVIRPLVVPPGPNALAVEYWQQHGLDQVLFMEIAKGHQQIPALIRQFLPEPMTVGQFYNGLFNWSHGTTIGDLENWTKIGLPGSSDSLISNLYKYADATLWRVNEFELIYNSIIEEDLWDVTL